MKFKLDIASEVRHSKAECDKYKDLGIVFNYHKDAFCSGWFKDDDALPTIDIGSLEELMQFIDKWGKVIVDRESIVVYDDYIE